MVMMETDPRKEKVEADHAQKSLVTVTEKLPPAAGTCRSVGETVTGHLLRVIRNCFEPPTTKDRITSKSALLDRRVNVTTPLPLPSAPEIRVNALGASVVACHAQPGTAVTVKAPEPPFSLND
jgi:hypothetical protein